MKNIIRFCLISAIFFGVSPVFAAKGMVVYIKSGCSSYIVETNMGFAILEWFGGGMPLQGNVLTGDFESFGMKDVYNLSQSSETKVWVDRYWMSKDQVIKRYSEKCH